MSVNKMAKAQTILLVDSDKTRCQQLSSRLRTQGFDVDECPFGFQSLGRIEERADEGLPYRLVIMAQSLSDTGDFEAVTLIRSEWNAFKLPIIVMGTEVGEQTREDALIAGADYIIEYSPNINELVTLIKEFINN